MQQQLLENEDQMTCGQSFSFNCLLGLKIASLVILTYGLMVAMFKLCLVFETLNGSIPEGYMTGGGIILALFLVNVIFWGSLWCWGAQRREALRRSVVERQLSMIRQEQRLQEEKDLEQERIMIQQRRMRVK